MYDEDYVPYTAKRWNEIPAVRVVGESEISPEEEAEATEKLERLIERSQEICAKKKSGLPVDDRL